MDDNKKTILKELKPLFDKAEKEGLFFVSNYGNLWFTPNKLKELQAEGKFVWGAVNWELKDPQIRIDALNGIIKDFRKELNKFKKEINSLKESK